MNAGVDERFMARALQLARRGMYTADPNPRVGCVLVKNGDIVGEGFHVRTGGPHAEVAALADSGGNASGATAYVTLEPCSYQGRTPPCVDALKNIGVRRVVAAMQDPNPRVAGSGTAALRDAGIEVREGVLGEQAAALNPGFISRMTRQRPWVRIKSAISLDGRTAMASGESQWITGAAARRDVQLLRARSSAVMTGSGTVVADDPSLNVRLSADELGIEGPVRQPLRVIADTSLRTPAGANLFKAPGKCVIFSTTDEGARADALRRAGASIARVGGGDSGIDLLEAMHKLAALECNEVHVEAGTVLCSALLAHGLVDELVIYMAPHLMGDAARGLVKIAGGSMNDRIPLQIDDVTMIGNDLRVSARPQAEC